MALFTSYSHFASDPIKVPNAGPSTGQNPEATSLNGFITKYEPRFLKEYFGYEMYQQFITGYDNNEPDYLAIGNGATYIDQYGIMQKWEGFQSGNNPIANYTFCHILKDRAATLFGIGVRKLKGENMDEASIDAKLVDAWNEMVRFNFNLHEFLYANMDKYPKYVGFIHNVYYYNPDCIHPNQELFIAKNIWDL